MPQQTTKAEGLPVDPIVNSNSRPHNGLSIIRRGRIGTKESPAHRKEKNAMWVINEGGNRLNPMFRDIRRPICRGLDEHGNGKRGK